MTFIMKRDGSPLGDGFFWGISGMLQKDLYLVWCPLFATSGRKGMTWGIEGYPANSSGGRRSWIKYAANNSSKTRTIRCIKTPVRYMYE